MVLLTSNSTSSMLGLPMYSFGRRGSTVLCIYNVSELRSSFIYTHLSLSTHFDVSTLTALLQAKDLQWPFGNSPPPNNHKEWRQMPKFSRWECVCRAPWSQADVWHQLPFLWRLGTVDYVRIPSCSGSRQIKHQGDCWHDACVIVHAEAQCCAAMATPGAIHY